MCESVWFAMGRMDGAAGAHDGSSGLAVVWLCVKRFVVERNVMWTHNGEGREEDEERGRGNGRNEERYVYFIVRTLRHTVYQIHYCLRFQARTRL